MSILILLLVLLFIIFIYYHLVYKLRNHLPGPKPLPFLGNVIQLHAYGGDVEQLLIKWRKTYGDCYTIWIGEKPFVMINGYKKIVELFENDNGRFSGRFNFDEKNDLMRGGSVAGILHTENDLWLKNRRLALKILRDFGLNKNLMQERILVEVQHFIDNLNEQIDHGAEEHNLRELIEARIGSVINALLFNYRFTGEKLVEFRTIKTLMSEYVTLAGSMIFRLSQSNSKLFLHVPFINEHVKKTQMCSKKLISFFQNQIIEHRQHDHDNEPVDFVDAYLRKQDEADDPDYNDYQLTHVIFDMWLAGQETTSTVLTWGLIYLMEHPEVQQKMRIEMDRAVGRERLITVADKWAIPYTTAVVNEILRLSNILAVNVMHKTLADVEINGYLIPKGACILPQISTVLYDEEVFHEPRKFRPERFLDHDGNFKRIAEWIPFSIGRRKCLGESLALMESFLFVANIFHRFIILPGTQKSRFNA
ncbi:Cytochrome P450 33C9 [Aphelenchoides besseyi]|nr:Cytochrome P450 33C9 [Aphelenchoides besseyi]